MEVAMGLLGTGFAVILGGIAVYAGLDKAAGSGIVAIGGILVTLGIVAIGVSLAGEDKPAPIAPAVQMVPYGQFEPLSWVLTSPTAEDPRWLITCNVWLAGKITAVEDVWSEKLYVEFWQRRRRTWSRRVVGIGVRQAPDGSTAKQMEIGYGAKLNGDNPLIISLTGGTLFNCLTVEPLHNANIRRGLNVTLVVELRHPHNVKPYRYDIVEPNRPIQRTQGSQMT